MKILIAGDYCPIGRTKEYLVKENYKDLFNGYENIVNEVDYAVVNFECPITTSNTKIEKTGPCIKTNDINALKALKYAGFNLLTLANNHIQDYSGQGVLDTMNHAQDLGFDFVGAGKDRFESSRPFISNINGIKVGFLNIAENEFCAATETVPGAYTFDFIENTKAIQNLRRQVDKLIVIYHGGREHYQLPTPEQRKRFRYFIEIGADAVVGHHTHCISGNEIYEGKPIVYSLGNFIFDYKKKYQKGIWTEGMSVILSLKEKEKNFEIELIPHFQGRQKNSALTLLKGQEKLEFLEKLDLLSKKIYDDKSFFEEWYNYLKTQEVFYLSSIYIKNLLIRVLFFKKLLPISLLRSKHNKLILNLMRCEAHHEILKEILNSKK